MTRLMFVVPAYGREELAAICLRQLRRTVDALCDFGIHADAVVIADDENLDTARDLDFNRVRRDNTTVGRKFNDGIQFACDPAHNPHPADYVVPIGSDDWVDWRILTDLPGPHRMLGFTRMAFVKPDGSAIAEHTVRSFIGGGGIRVYPASWMQTVGYRPADEHRQRGNDTSIWVNLRKRLEEDLVMVNGDRHGFQIVDWKSPDVQINAYEDVGRWRTGDELPDPFTVLRGVYPDEALDEMRAHYGQRVMVAA